MFDSGRPTRSQELMIMGSLAFVGFLDGVLAAANSAQWKTAGAGYTLDGILPFTPSGASGYLAFVGLLTFVLCGVLFPLVGQEPRAPALLRSSGAWLVGAAVLFVLWTTGAGALSGAQGALYCNGATSYYGVPCGLGNASLAFAWIAWVIAFAHLFTASLWFWKRHDIVPGSKPWRRSYITANNSADKLGGISRPRPHDTPLEHVGQGGYSSKLNN